jgi:hypothetical protein
MGEFSSSWHSYPSIFNMGHKAIQDLLKGEVNVEEKVDGSQFSFGVFEDKGEEISPGMYSGPYGLELKVRSKGAVMNPEAPEHMFKGAVEHVKSIADKLHVGWTYRGECLAKPHHNALIYDRIPNGHVILFDINTGDSEFLSYEDKVAEAARLGLEVVPLLFSGIIPEIGTFRGFLDNVSILGGQKIEGVVVKPIGYDLYGRDKKVLMGKFVSEAFKEVHSKTWGENNPGMGDIIQKIIAGLSTQARWQKALQHLREAGQIEDNVRDIGLLMREIPEDVKKECEDEIKEALFSYAWPHIKRGVARGCPEWYKDYLLRQQFEREGSLPAYLEGKLLAKESGGDGETVNRQADGFSS